MKLYEIHEEIERILDLAVDMETGEIKDDSFALALDKLEIELERKALDCAVVVRGMKAEVEVIQGEETRLRKRKEALRHDQERLKEYIARNLKPGDKYKDARATVYWSNSEGVKVSEDWQMELPEKYIRTETTRSPELQNIKAAIKRGEKVPGAELEKRSYLAIR